MPLPDWVWAKVDRSGDCWLWTGMVDSSGYGVVKIAQRSWKVHRVVYADLVGPIPDGLQIDHLCRVRRCCNPRHLEPVTQLTNIMRGEGVTAAFTRQTHCKHGHEFTPENTYMWRTSRHCRTCRAERDRQARQRA